ncbi:MAG: cytochrome C oxidase subunit II [Rhodobacterales bacterium]|nr:cytochrome C oxidase subunit II [Rhodobacterales bacterium]
MIDLLVQRASTYAADIDNLILLITVITGVWFFLTEFVFFGLLWKFRYQEGKPAQYVTGKEKHLKKWINWPHFLVICCDLIIVVAAVQVWYNVKQDMPEVEKEIRVVGQRWAWSFVHPGADAELGTDDDIKTVGELHIVSNEVYKFNLESRDVMHSFSVPVFRLKQDAIPGRVIQGWFEANAIGQFDIQCAEMCGIGHGIMGAQLFVDTPEEHAAWIAANSN